MKKIELDELRSIQIEILDKVAEYCKQNGLQYFLSSGTLIGAVRHKGYIPWDDDIDLYMPRKDYQLFLDGFNGYDDDYFVQSLGTEPSYNLSYAKVERKGTVMEEGFDTKLKIGVNIDILPVDGVPDDLQERKTYFDKIWRLRNKYVIKVLHIDFQSRGVLKNIILAAGKTWLCFKSLREISQALDDLIDKNNDKTKFVCNLTTNNKLGSEIPRSAIEGTADVEFEGKIYKTMVGWHEYLTKNYGDYMQMPPEDKRVSNHIFNAYWVQ